MATVSERSQLEDEVYRHRISILTWAIVLFVPTYSVTVTNSSFGPITETIFFWPWVILIRLQPNFSLYDSDQYVLTGIPWTLILFIPFFYVLNLSWQMYTNDEDKIIKSSLIVLASLLQLGLIGMTFRSQDVNSVPAGQEDVTVWYIPQILLIIIHGFVASNWYFNETKQVLLDAKNKREMSEPEEDLNEKL